MRNVDSCRAMLGGFEGFGIGPSFHHMGDRGPWETFGLCMDNDEMRGPSLLPKNTFEKNNLLQPC